MIFNKFCYMHFMQIKLVFSDFLIYDQEHLIKALLDMYRKERQEKTWKS